MNALKINTQDNKHACECGKCHAPLNGGRDTFVDKRYAQVLCLDCRCEHWNAVDNRAFGGSHHFSPLAGELGGQSLHVG